MDAASGTLAGSIRRSALSCNRRGGPTPVLLGSQLCGPCRQPRCVPALEDIRRGLRGGRRRRTAPGHARRAACVAPTARAARASLARRPC